MVFCSISNCGNSSKTCNLTNKGITFHMFPKDPDIKDKWISATGKRNWFPTNNSRICSVHFINEQFNSSTKRRTLVKSAVPTVDVWQFITSPAQVDSEPDAEDMPGTSEKKSASTGQQSKVTTIFKADNSFAQVDSDSDGEDMPGTLLGITSQDSTSGNEIKVFCPKCNTEVSHTAEGIQEDQTKILVAKVYHYFEQEYEELKKIYGDLDLTPLSKFRQRTALATGVSETTLQQILKEEEERNADKRREPPQNRRAARKRRRQSDSSSEEGSLDGNVEEQPSYVEEIQTLVVKMEPPESNIDEPEIYIPTEVKLEPSDDISKAQLLKDPISVDLKTEPRDDEVDTAVQTLLLSEEPAATKRRGRKTSRKNDDTSSSTLQHTPGESSAAVASSSVPLTVTLNESCPSGETEIKMEDEDIHEEGFS